MFCTTFSCYTRSVSTFYSLTTAVPAQGSQQQQAQWQATARLLGLGLAKQHIGINVRGCLTLPPFA
jgi:hypothetical protein